MKVCISELPRPTNEPPNTDFLQETVNKVPMSD